MCTATRTSSYSPVGPRVFLYIYPRFVLCVFICPFWFVCMSPFFYVSLSSWVISLTVFDASVTNLNEPPRALATSTIAWDGACKHKATRVKGVTISLASQYRNDLYCVALKSTIPYYTIPYSFLTASGYTQLQGEPLQRER